MKNKILLISLIAALSLSAVSCGSKDSSSESKNTDSSSVSATENAAPDENSGETDTEKVTTENTKAADLTDIPQPKPIPDLFSYDLPENAVEKTELANPDRNYKGYQIGESAVILFGPMIDYHQSAHFAGTSIMEAHMADEEKKYTNFTSSDLELNGVPAFKFTAKFNVKFNDNIVDCVYSGVFLQYGNGDTFVMLSFYPSAEKDKYEPICEQIISSVKYLGEPLKTEDEHYSSDICSMTVGKDFYSVEKNNGVSVQLNITNSMKEYVSRINVKPAEKTIEELKKSWEEKGKHSNIESGEAAIGNYNAKYLKSNFTTTDRTFEQCSYFVDTPNGSYEILVMSSEGMYDEFMERAKPIIDSLVLK